MKPAIRKGALGWFHHARGGIIVGTIGRVERMPAPYGKYRTVCGLSCPADAVAPLSEIPEGAVIQGFDSAAAAALGVECRTGKTLVELRSLAGKA
jgi:hypothetical protein